jgi:acyl CoA:acetate/3-ketoacid CoA transferase beta subunit
MPSPEHAASLERLLSRAAEECESKQGIWFGLGLPQALRSAIDLRGKGATQAPAEIAFIEVSAVSPQGRAVGDTVPSGLDCPIVGLSQSSVDQLGSLVCARGDTGVQITRLICPFAVFDFSAEGVRVREVRHGLTAADLQAELSTTLWSGPDLKELGTH